MYMVELHNFACVKIAHRGSSMCRRGSVHRLSSARCGVLSCALSAAGEVPSVDGAGAVSGALLSVVSGDVSNAVMALYAV